MSCKWINCAAYSLESIQCTLDYPCIDYLVWGLSMHDRKLLIINDERWEITWYSAECLNRILNTEIGNFRAYS
jgi:hypothetical protein